MEMGFSLPMDCGEMRMIRFFFLNNGKEAKCLPLAPIAMKILISRGSAYKIVMESGTIFPKMPNVPAPNSND
jgi:hypothetical protein